MKNQETGITRELLLQASILLGLVILMWSIEIIDQLLGGILDRFGILPRTILGLRGIVFAPLLHGGFMHLASNTVPFIVLGWLVMLRRTSDFIWVTLIVVLVSGLGTWVFGSPGFHIGASGVIFGYLGFLLLRGYFERSFFAIFLSVVVAFLYGGLLLGVLPNQPGISWEGHLFGFIGGGIAARLLSEPRAKSDSINDQNW
jgi:membrane associated rhomboid family serine protease